MKNDNDQLNSLVEGWRFQLIEISPNYYRIEGKDALGHSVSRTCSEIELDETLKLCAKDALEIDNQLDKKNYRENI